MKFLTLFSVTEGTEFRKPVLVCTKLKVAKAAEHLVRTIQFCLFLEAKEL